MTAGAELALLRTHGLAVGYRRRGETVTVLADVEETLEPGELVCVLGPNGAGKSTLLRTLTGLLPPLRGRIDLLGTDLAAFTPRERARRVGVVLPERPPAGLLTVESLVALGRYPHTDWTGRLRPEDHERVRDALARVGAAKLVRRDVLALSDGERQRVLIARALAQEPRLLVLDEPTAFLDLPGRVEIMGLLRTLAHAPGAGAGRAVVLSTHDLDLALRTADRLWLLGAGGSIASGAPEDLVLSGAFESVWRSDQAEFDPGSGSWRLARQASGTAAVLGDGTAALWTRRALERAGYEVADGGDVVVEVAGGPPGTSWTWRRRTASGEAGSVAELLRALSA